MCFDILNQAYVAHKCDRRTDRQTERLLAIAQRANEGLSQQDLKNCQIYWETKNTLTDY